MKSTVLQNLQQLPGSSKQLDAGIIRRYTAADHPRIAEICRNVYGGTDVLPRTIQTQLLHNPAATVLLSQPAAEQPVNGVVCAELRGNSSYLFGLRVAEEARGRGVASKLMAAACHHGCTHSHIQHIQSTTIPPNTQANRIFRRLGFVHSRTVERWPQEPLQSGYEAAVGFKPNTQQPDRPVQFAPQQPHMLDHIPGARQVIRNAAGCVQPHDWVCCRSIQQLQQAVASVRQQQEQLGQHEYSSLGQSGYMPPSDWLPWVFEVQPLSAPWVQRRVAAGEVWLLPAPHPSAHAQHDTEYTAAVVLSHSELNSRTCAGVLAAAESGVAAALELVDSLVPHFVAYIDSGTRHSSGAEEPGLQLPPVLELGRQGLHDRVYMCYIVYSREASHRGLPEVSGLSVSRL